MSERLYFAYGSNLLPARLIERCPSARVAGTGVLHGYATDYSKKGRDGSGKATIFRSKGSVTPGALYWLAPACFARLDEIEGPGYAKLPVTVDCAARQVVAETYMARPEAREDGLAPFDWYRGRSWRGWKCTGWGMRGWRARKLSVNLENILLLFRLVK